MSIAFQVNKRVAVLRDGKFYNCIAFAIEDDSNISVGITNEGLLISFGEVEFRMSFIDFPTDIKEITFVLVDPSQDQDRQIIGIAETHCSDESQPGRVYLLK